MEKPTTPINEQNRLGALNSYEILDTLEEKEYNDRRRNKGRRRV